MNSKTVKRGQSVQRLEDERLLRGHGRFVDNLNFEGQVYLHVVRSYLGHAKILNIQAESAFQLPGVVAVFTGEDLIRDGVLPIPMTLPYKRPGGLPALSEPYHALAQGAVRFLGQPVAIVIAESPAAALEGGQCLEIEYEELEAVTDLQQAISPDAPRLCDELPDNIAAAQTEGDAEKVEKAFAKASHVTRMNLVNNRVVGSPLEPRALLCEIEPKSGNLVLHAMHQSFSRLQAVLCEVFQLEADKLRIIVRDIGGGFGTKVAIHPEDVLVVYAAKKINRTVKWIATRSEEFQASVHGRDQRNFAELAFDSSGKILALRLSTLANSGAYLNNPALLIPLGIMPKVVSSVYHIPAVFIETRCVLTNTAPIGAYRGAGRPEGIYQLERLMDLAAREMEISPVTLRKINLIRSDSLPYTTQLGEVYDSGNFHQVMQSAVSKMDWDGFGKRKAASEKRGLLRGRGLACYIEWTGGELVETVRIEAGADGTVSLFSGTQAMGQGLETVFSQLLSSQLEIPIDAISVVQGDSARVKGLGSFGSRSLFVGGSVLLAGSQEFLEKGKQLAAAELEAAVVDMRYHEGRFEVVGTSIGIGLFELAARQTEHSFSTETEKEVEGRSWPNGCHIAEVEIDPETGSVSLVSHCSVDDTGNPINPIIVEGQLHGGIAQGAGQALLELSEYDSEGQLLTGSFMDYAMPRADDLPSFKTNIYTDAPCKTNALGAKGVGEIGVVGSIPAIANAVLDALWEHGVRQFDMPAHPQKIWKLLQNQKSVAN
ncbi:MAG: xanthine dehydrogenase family protein molybdopterin-binding subunit [SAR324 cluster bacterium]|nr:xanthine dehydrogenase family protein molybdopterin-binding subunit [SAR324 cluster bacterium]